MALAMDRKSRNGVHAARPPGGSGGGSKWQVWQDFGIPKSRLSSLKSGGREGIRTPGLLVANEALSQLSYSPTSSREILANVGEGSHLRLIVCAIFVYMWAQLGVEKAAALRNLRVDKTLTLQKKEGAIRALVAYQLCD